MPPSPTIFVTGTDTGVGKTVLTALLLTHLRQRGIHALAMKPFCTGSRADPRLLCRLQDWEVPLDWVNPFFFSDPLAPMVAARREHRHVQMQQAIQAVNRVRPHCECLLIEGVGGLLVPLGDRYSVFDLITRLNCERVLVAAQNKLGVLNHLLLTLAALGERFRKRATIVLMNPRRANLVSRTNRAIVPSLIDNEVVQLPFLNGDLGAAVTLQKHAALLRKVLIRPSLKGSR